MKLHLLFSSALILSWASTQALAGDNCGMSGAAADPGAPAKASEIKTGGGVSEAQFPEIGQQELVKAIADKAVFIVDANGSDSYGKGHIPGAIDFDAAGNKFASMLPKNKDAMIVAYCGGPGCHAWCKAADKLKQLGYTNVRHFKDGIKGWKTAGLKTETPTSQKG